MGRAAPVEALVRAEFPVWGGRAVVAVTEAAGLDAAVAGVRRVVDAVDLACSSFRADSELAAVNRSDGRELPISPLLGSVIAEALRVARLTDGAVDPTVGQVLVAHRITPALDDRPVRIEPIPGHSVVRLDVGRGTVGLPVGVRLDLGATGKALAADMAAAQAHAAAGCGVLVGLCGDVAVAGAPPAGGWPIRVTDDHRSGDAPGQTVSILVGGLATSSVTVRRSGDGPQAAHHLIDPRSGRPAGGPWRTVSVTAATCTDANAASTAAIILGPAAPAWLHEHRLPARLVAHDGRITRVAGWPCEGDDLAETP
ncbi:MAG TPA: FAD:protein FMN transferase [Solirubrobacteraceae bacterium]|nr:FAD:protein FMN transferase [Solirubrobacteraceae bacterium]